MSRQCRTYFHLAHYTDNLFKSYEERLSSNEWQAALRLRKYKVTELTMPSICDFELCLSWSNCYLMQTRELETLMKRLKSSSKARWELQLLSVAGMQGVLFLLTHILSLQIFRVRRLITLRKSKSCRNNLHLTVKKHRRFRCAYTVYPSFIPNVQVHGPMVLKASLRRRLGVEAPPLRLRKMAALGA